MDLGSNSMTKLHLDPVDATDHGKIKHTSSNSSEKKIRSVANLESHGTFWGDYDDEDEAADFFGENK